MWGVPAEAVSYSCACLHVCVCVSVDRHVCPPVSPLSRFDGRTRAVEED